MNTTTAKKQAIRDLSKKIALQSKDRFNLTPREEAEFASIVEQVLMRRLQKYDLPGVKLSEEEANELIDEIKFEIRKRQKKILIDKIPPSHRVLREHLKKSLT